MSKSSTEDFICETSHLSKDTTAGRWQQIKTTWAAWRWWRKGDRKRRGQSILISAISGCRREWRTEKQLQRNKSTRGPWTCTLIYQPSHCRECVSERMRRLGRHEPQLIVFLCSKLFILSYDRCWAPSQRTSHDLEFMHSCRSVSMLAWYELFGLCEQLVKFYRRHLYCCWYQTQVTSVSCSRGVLRYIRIIGPTHTSGQVRVLDCMYAHHIVYDLFDEQLVEPKIPVLFIVHFCLRKEDCRRQQGCNTI